MTTMFETRTQFDVEAMPGYADIRARFEQNFQNFVDAKKLQAVHAVLKEEFTGTEKIVKNPDFIQAIANRVDDEALLEKRYIFISVNPQALI